jgi:mannose-6-phosphate isomerase-like protein (cupin superfamily)
MHHVRGSDIFAADDAGFRRRIIDEGTGPVRSYAFSAPRNTDTNEHCHEHSAEIFLAVEGEGVIVVSGQEVKMQQYDVLVVDPGEYHFVRNGPTPFHLLAVVAPNQDDVKEPE